MRLIRDAIGVTIKIYAFIAGGVTFFTLIAAGMIQIHGGVTADPPNALMIGWGATLIFLLSWLLAILHWVIAITLGNAIIGRKRVEQAKRKLRQQRAANRVGRPSVDLNQIFKADPEFNN